MMMTVNDDDDMDEEIQALIKAYADLDAAGLADDMNKLTAELQDYVNKLFENRVEEPSQNPTNLSSTKDAA